MQIGFPVLRKPEHVRVRFSRFPSSPLLIRVHFFLLIGFNKGNQEEKGQKGTTGEPSFSSTTAVLFG